MSKAVIFDLDGVLTDTSEYHYFAWQRLADENGLAFSRLVNEQLRGVSRVDSLKIILGRKQVSSQEFESMLVQKNRYYLKLVKNISPQSILPGVLDILDVLAKKNITLAVGSSSKNAKTILNKLGITSRFTFIADGYCVAKAKPAPDIFLLVAQKLLLTPNECLVVEDAAAGIEAAHRAGMASLGLGQSAKTAQIWYESLAQVSPNQFLSVLKKLSR